ncbi:hypothetical protein [Wolbachia endosymbiont of Tribolium confusum]|uniref:hypothetical protein n=1 Tax=Wolbachia endosymbiont of Tribolium confusum TaxID=214474 RepID=UPI001CF2C06F|nr:hypothetical protein [Wolbachia endosymbiont of Tribolium confusum]MCA7010195.1 hypothetical protein [Wolbachia endosymbiont of Tribolium confusum]
MLGTTQENQNELGQFNQEQWDQFVENSIKKEKEDLEVVKEQSKKNKKENIETLEKHFHDRTIQPISEFKKVGEKEAGCSSGFQAEHEYSNNEGDKATFMIKSVLNHTLTEKEKQSKLAQFKESFYKGSRKATKLQNPYLSDSVIDNNIDQLWQKIESNICYDDLNIADFIREYVAGDLYKLFLYDRAPIVELVTNNDLPKERFANGNDQFKEHIEQEKNQDQLHLRSKFLDKFTTLMDLKKKGENYQDAKGFEKILAAQILLGETDIIQPENFGVIEKEYENAKEKLWEKIDHGRSFYLSFSSTKDYLQNFFSFLTILKSYGIKIDLEKLSKELGDFIDCYDKNKKKFETLIDRKESTLNHVLNPKMQFRLEYIDGSKLHNRNFSYMDGEFKNQKKMANLSCLFSPMQAASYDSPGISLSDYFKQNLETQVKMARSLTGPLKDLAGPWKNFDRIERIHSYITKPSFYLFVPTLIAAIFTSGTLGTAFTVAAAVTGMCMLVGIVTSICLYAYALNSCNSKINDPKIEEFQREPQLC